MENNRFDTSEKVFISGSIKTAGEYKEVQGVGFDLVLKMQGAEFVSSKRELMNKILTPVLFELAREEELQ